jgi:hypothetical protein
MCSNHYNKQATNVNNDDSSHFNDQEHPAFGRNYELDEEHSEEENEEEDSFGLKGLKHSLPAVKVSSKPSDLQSNASQNSPYNSYFSNRTYIEVTSNFIFTL